MVDYLSPRRFADRIRSQKFVRHHSPADFSSVGKSRDRHDNLREWCSAKVSKCPDFGCWQQDFSGDIVAVPFNPRLDACAADSRSTEPEMRHFVKRGERPRWPCVLIVNDNEGRNRIGDGETPEYID
jgi:hypothetical protein